MCMCIFAVHRGLSYMDVVNEAADLSMSAVNEAIQQAQYEKDGEVCKVFVLILC